jgi:hypothetical protein
VPLYQNQTKFCAGTHKIASQVGTYFQTQDAIFRAFVLNIFVDSTCCEMTLCESQHKVLFDFDAVALLLRLLSPEDLKEIF